eukprot:SAG31_NODE_7975_length_1550_cov_4.577533_1_plen_81_part_00
MRKAHSTTKFRYTGSPKLDLNLIRTFDYFRKFRLHTTINLNLGETGKVLVAAAETREHSDGATTAPAFQGHFTWERFGRS